MARGSSVVVEEELIEGSSREEPGAALFVQQQSTGRYFINPQLGRTDAALRAYWFSGWLLAQALPNRAVFGWPLAPVLFEKLLAAEDFKPSLETLQQHDPDAAAALQQVITLPPAELSQLLRLEGLPSTLAARQYTETAAARLLVDDVAWQYGALAQGFWAAGSLSRGVLEACCIGSQDLAAAVCGDAAPPPPSGPSMLQTFRIVLEGEEGLDGGGPSSSERAVVECLWEVLDGWPADLVVGFLRFTTGSERYVYIYTC